MKPNLYVDRVREQRRSLLKLLACLTIRFFFFEVHFLF